MNLKRKAAIVVGNEAVTTALDSVIDVVGKMAIGNLQLDNSIGDKMEAQDNVDWDEETQNGCMNRGHNFALKAVEQAIKDMKGKALDIKCDICGKRLDQLGALYFSPPKNNVVVKTHICVSCDKLMNQAIKKMKEE